MIGRCLGIEAALTARARAPCPHHARDPKKNGAHTERRFRNHENQIYFSTVAMALATTSRLRVFNAATQIRPVLTA
jgi:hypothetical protein